MRHTPPTDISPRTARQHPGASRLDGFDCQLPDGAREELLAPKRARMLGRPVQGRMPRRWLKSLLSFVAIIMTLVAAFALLVGIITLCGFGTHSQAPGRDVLPGRAFHPMPTPASTPLVQPPVVQTPAPRVPEEPEVRRAELVPVTVHRAALWRLANQELGVYQWYPLPEVWGGGSVWARYCGTVEHFSHIPPNRSRGDL